MEYVVVVILKGVDPYKIIKYKINIKMAPPTDSFQYSQPNSLQRRRRQSRKRKRTGFWHGRIRDRPYYKKEREKKDITMHDLWALPKKQFPVSLEGRLRECLRKLNKQKAAVTEKWTKEVRRSPRKSRRRSRRSRRRASPRSQRRRRSRRSPRRFTRSAR